MHRIRKLRPCLWFDGQAEEAAKFYTSMFADSRITHVSRYGEAGKEIHGREPGSAMVVGFELEGHPFTGLNGGPHFKFSEAISFEIHCDTQQDIDYFWDRLGDGGDENAKQCGWLKDRFGVSWQVIPSELGALLSSGGAAAERTMTALLQMKKLDIAALKRAHAGEEATANA